MGIFINKLDQLGRFKQMVIWVGKLMRRGVAYFQSNPWSQGPLERRIFPLDSTNCGALSTGNFNRNHFQKNSKKMNIPPPLACVISDPNPRDLIYVFGHVKLSHGQANGPWCSGHLAGRDIWCVDIDPKPISGKYTLQNVSLESIRSSLSDALSRYLNMDSSGASDQQRYETMARKAIPNLTTRSMHGGPSQRPWGHEACSHEFFNLEAELHEIFQRKRSGNPSDRSWSSNSLQTSEFLAVK